MSNLHEFINPPAPIALTALTNDLLKQIEDLAIRVGGAQERAQISNENAMLCIARCEKLEAENAKLKKENDELLQSALTFAQGDDHGKNRVAELQEQVKRLNDTIERLKACLVTAGEKEASEFKRWQWAIDLRSASDCKQDGAHLADWLKGFVESLTKIESIPGSTDHSSLDAVWAERQRQIVVEGFSSEHDDTLTSGALASTAACYAIGSKFVIGSLESKRKTDIWSFLSSWWKPKDQRSNLVKAGALILAEIDRLDRAAAREAESQSQAAEAITDAQAVQMIAQDLEANAEDIGLVATGVTNEKGQMLYCSKNENSVPDELADQLIKEGYTMHNGMGLPVDMNSAVKVCLRDGQIFLSFASNLIWNNTGEPDDIIAYKVKP